MSNISVDMRKTVAKVIGLALSLCVVFLAANIPLRFGLLIYTEQVLALMLGLALAAGFLLHPVKSKLKYLRHPDWLFAALGMAIGLWLMVRYPILASDFFELKAEATYIGVIAMLLILEGIRRTTGWSLTIIALSFILYAFFADKVPGDLEGRPISPSDLAAFSVADNLAVFGLPLTTIGMVVVMFILFGQLLQRSGGAEWFTDIATVAVGRFRGGPAKVAIVASGLFGSISGSAVANVASTGIVTIPMMKKHGFSPERAAAYEAAASTGGQITPPIMGAAAFVMAEFLQVPYMDIVVAAIIPALLFYFSVLLSADLEAAKLKSTALSADERPNGMLVMKQGWFFILPFALLIWVLFNLNKSPAEAALWGSAALIVVSLIFSPRDKKLTPKKLLNAIILGGLAAKDVILIGAVAGIILGILEVTGLSFGLTYMLVSLGENSLWLLLTASGIVCIVLGMGMPTTGIYLLVATLAAPPLIELGIEPIGAHLFVLYFGLLSMITPPVAIAAFTAATIAGAKPMRTAFETVKVAWIAFAIPYIFVTDPTLLMQGDGIDIVRALIVVILAIWAVAAALSGYLFTHLNMLLRSGAMLGGVILLASRLVSDWRLEFEVAGLVIFVFVGFMNYSERKGGELKLDI